LVVDYVQSSVNQAINQSPQEAVDDEPARDEEGLLTMLIQCPSACRRRRSACLLDDPHQYTLSSRGGEVRLASWWTVVPDLAESPVHFYSSQAARAHIAVVW